MTRFEKWALFGGAAFAGLASLALHGYATYYPLNQTLTQAAYAGENIEIRLTPEACAGPLAHTELNCDYPYFGHRGYLPKRLWLFAGRKRGSSVSESNEFGNAPDEPGVLSLWGVVTKFDDSGRLICSGGAVGTVQLVTRHSR
jgi:hypothetical protein